MRSVLFLQNPGIVKDKGDGIYEKEILWGPDTISGISFILTHMGGREGNTMTRKKGTKNSDGL